MKLKFKREKSDQAKNDLGEGTYKVDPAQRLGVQAGLKKDQKENPKQQKDQKTHEEFTYVPKKRFKASKLLRMILPLIMLTAISSALYFFAKQTGLLTPKQVGVKGQIVWWGIGTEEEVAGFMIEKYKEQNPGVNIKYIKQSEIDYGQRLRSAIDQGIGPDIFSFHNSWTPMFKDDLDVVPEKIYSRDEYSGVFYPVALRYSSTSDGIVGIPLEYDAITLYINEDIFSQAGKPIPRTWDQFSQTASDLTTKGEKNFIVQSGAAMGIVENIDYWPEIMGLIILQNKAGILRPTEKTAPEAITFYTDFYNKTKVWDSSLPGSVEAFAGGKVAMIIAPIRAYQEIKSLNPNLRFRTSTLPQIRRDDPDEPEVSYASYWLQGVSRKSINQDAAWNFLKFLSESDSLLAMNQKRAELGIAPKVYPRVDMRDLIINDRYMGSVAALAPVADSGYLAYDTQDGPEGINTLLGDIYKGGVYSLTTAKRKSNIGAVSKKMATEIAKVVFKFGLR